MPNFLHESFTSWQLTINVWECIITLLELCPFYTWKMMCELILICISLTMNATEHLFMWLRATIFLYFSLSCWYFLTDLLESFLYYENRHFACVMNYKYFSCYPLVRFFPCKIFILWLLGVILEMSSPLYHS